MVFGLGERGNSVSKLQGDLGVLGIDPGPIDGIFGAQTKAAVIEFQSRYLVTGTVDPHTLAKLEKAADAERERQKMAVPVPSGLAEIEQTFGVIEWDRAEGGYIVITNGWAKVNITTEVLPVVGKAQIHTKLVSTFWDVFTEIEGEGLADEVEQFGTWCPRHKMHNPNRGLSSHSWAIACDLNWATNPVGRAGDLDPKIVQIFEAHGFVWGGRWKHRDDMHFQYCRNY